METSWYTSPNCVLSDNTPISDGADTYDDNYACGTGRHSRYDRLYLQNVETYYDDWDGREDLMLRYTSEPFSVDTEVTEHRLVDLYFTCTEKDCTLFVYLSDIVPDGISIYVTEGVFRAMHRKLGAIPENIPPTGPIHSLNQADAELLVPSETTSAAFELLPTSYLFRQAHRLRFSIA